ncbi:MAG: hypothetical protein ACYSR7_01815 [Planctomycetota bacterium]
MKKRIGRDKGEYIKKKELPLVFRILDIPLPVYEYRFHSSRKWRFDFAWPDSKIALEWEGIISRKSGHTTVVGYTSNCEKYNAALLDGWSVYRITALHRKAYIMDLLGKIQF